MNTTQKIFNNFFLSFLSRLIAKAGDALLFIIIARMVGAEEAGVFRLAKSYMAVSLALSAWGLHDLLVRELAVRQNEGKKYLANYLFIRLLLAAAGYGTVLLVLSFNLPYSLDTKMVIRILSVAIFPEAIFTIFEAFFIAYDRLLPTTMAGFLSGVSKLIGGIWVLSFFGNNLALVAWMIPLGTIIGLIPFIPASQKLFSEFRQSAKFKLDFQFILEQLHQISGFILIGLFYNLNDQQDTFLVSILLNETQLGWYGAAQTILFGFSILSAATRIAIYPTMARYYQESWQKFLDFYIKINRYSILSILPLATLVSLFAKPITIFVFRESFEPAATALQWMIWEIFFLFLHIPNARFLLVQGKQKQLGWITGVGLLINLSLNLVLIPRFGINGAAISRPIIAFINFLLAYYWVKRWGIEFNVFTTIALPLVSTLLMTAVILQFRDESIFVAVGAGIIVYMISILVTGSVSRDDWRYLRQLYPKNNSS